MASVSETCSCGASYSHVDSYISDTMLSEWRSGHRHAEPLPAPAVTASRGRLPQPRLVVRRLAQRPSRASAGRNEADA